MRYTVKSLTKILISYISLNTSILKYPDLMVRFKQMGIT